MYSSGFSLPFTTPMRLASGISIGAAAAPFHSSDHDGGIGLSPSCRIARSSSGNAASRTRNSGAELRMRRESSERAPAADAQNGWSSATTTTVGLRAPPICNVRSRRGSDASTMFASSAELSAAEPGRSRRTSTPPFNSIVFVSFFSPSPTVAFTTSDTASESSRSPGNV